MEVKTGLDSVIFALQPGWNEQVQELADKLQDEGIFCALYDGRLRSAGWKMIAGNGGKKGKCRDGRWERIKKIVESEEFCGEAAKQTLIITDDRGLAMEMSHRQIACIGCVESEADFFDSTSLVVERLDELDAGLLEEFLLRYHGLPVTITQTERLVLREIAEEDFDVLGRISRQEGMKYVQNEMCGDFFERERLHAYISHVYRLFGYGLWSVLRKDGELIGCCGLSICGWEDGKTRLELQYMLDADWQGRGYGTEMCKAALEYTFVQLEAQEVWLRIHPQNISSLRLAQKLGFTFMWTGKDGMLCFRRTR